MADFSKCALLYRYEAREMVILLKGGLFQTFGKLLSGPLGVQFTCESILP